MPDKISVIGPGEKRIDTGHAATSVGDELRIPVRTDVPHGTYLVSYRVISADSHPVGNGFYYSVVREVVRRRAEAGRRRCHRSGRGRPPSR